VSKFPNTLLRLHADLKNLSALSPTFSRSQTFKRMMEEDVSERKERIYRLLQEMAERGQFNWINKGIFKKAVTNLFGERFYPRLNDKRNPSLMLHRDASQGHSTPSSQWTPYHSLGIKRIWKSIQRGI
jgi:hypothetical protein